MRSCLVFGLDFVMSIYLNPLTPRISRFIIYKGRFWSYFLICQDKIHQKSSIMDKSLVSGKSVADVISLLFVAAFAQISRDLLFVI